MDVSSFFFSLITLLNRVYILIFTNILSIFPVKLAFCVVVGVGLFGIVFKFLKG